MLGNAIRKSGHSQNSIARITGIDSSNINKMVAGHQKIPLHLAIQLERVLDITADSLLVTQLYDNIRDAREDLKNGTYDLVRRRSQRWTEEEDQFLLDHPDETNHDIGAVLGRTHLAVYRRRRDLGLKSVGSTSARATEDIR